MSDTLRCPLCGHDSEGLTLYSVAGVFRLLVCPACYGLLVAKERQPHSQPMKRLHRLLGLNGREVVNDAGRARCHTALGYSPSTVAQEEAQATAVYMAESAIGLVRRNTRLTRRNS